MAEETKQKQTKRITVDETALESIIESNKVLAEKVKMLEATADKSRLEWYRGTQKEAPKFRRVTLGEYPIKDGYRIILGWPTLPVNEMYQDTNSAWHERQIMHLFLEGGSELDIAYIDFVRRKRSVQAEIRSQAVDEATGKTTLKVETVDGRKFDIDQTFINI